MRKSLATTLSGLLATVAALLPVTPGHAQTELPFSTPAEARAYLEANPTGPLAEAAFRLIVDARLVGEYPSLPREPLIEGSTLVRLGTVGLSDEQLSCALAQLGLAEDLAAACALPDTIPVPLRVQAERVQTRQY